ncbi:hypothetical protein [Gemmatimonas sp.]|uniref:hypothetical protein n=1 Tax=Gemmatimonas sp. TaxID=1962908 RepID=UPI003F716F70
MNARMAVHALAALLAAGALGAQERTADARLLARADSITVGAYCDLAQRLLRDGTVLNALADDSSAVRVSAAVVCNPLLQSSTLIALTGGASAPMAAIARTKTNGLREVQEGILKAMGELYADLRRRDIDSAVCMVLGNDHAAFVRITETAQGISSGLARDGAIARLANYERKLGPTSARLNGAEVLLNYAAQRWVKGFRPTPLGGPKPWELITSYAPGYVTFVGGDLTPVPVSVAEFGFRYYLFGKRFGRTGLTGLLLPSYLSAGVVTASDANGALVWPWRGREQSGAFFGWGTIKFAWIDRDGRGSFLVTRQFQAIPFVF